MQNKGHEFFLLQSDLHISRGNIYNRDPKDKFTNECTL